MNVPTMNEQDLLKRNRADSDRRVESRAIGFFLTLPRALPTLLLDVTARPVCGASAAAFRILFGLLGVAAVARFAAKGWINELYIQPAHHFTYSGFWWVQPWPGPGMYIHFALLGLASLCVALGLRYRLSIIAFFVLFTYMELIDKTTYLNHYYWVSLVSLLMIFLPLNRWASLDAWLNPSLRAATVQAWVVWALRAQVGMVYVFGGIAKLNPDWLLRGQPMRIWLYNSSDLFLIGPLLREEWVAYAMSWCGAAFDLTIVAWLLWHRSRPLAYAVLVVFHIATWLLFPIGMFPWIMICASLVFFPTDWPHRLKARVLGRPEPPTASASGGSDRIPPSWRVYAASALAFVVVLAQLAIPLRHWAYPGNVRWNDDGYRFSWRVMLTEKTGHVRFRVTLPTVGETRLVYPVDYLTPIQTERMAYQPDMILATARLIADDFKSIDGAVEVRADAFVSFNGRPTTRFIDPDIDLARVEPGIWPKRWVLPAPDDG